MLELELFTVRHSDIIEFSKLIPLLSLQKNLQHIIIISNYSVAIDSSIFNFLSTLSESLQILEFNHSDFDKMDDKTLCLLNNIRELKLTNCKKMNNLNSWAKCLTKLE